MTLRRGRLAPLLLITLVSMGAVGCTGMVRRIAVRQVTGELEEAFALDDAQSERASASINLLIDEVPTLVLPALSRLVAEADETIAAGATEEKLRSLERGWDALADRVAGRVLDELAPLLASLRDAQIGHGAAYGREKLAESREELNEEGAARLEERQDSFVESVETWAGSLSAAQARALRRHVTSQPDESSLRLDADERRLEMVERTLRAHPGAPAVRAVLWNLWRGRDDLGPDAPTAAERRARGRATLLFVDAMMTAAQRAHAREHLAGEHARARRFLGEG